MLSLKKTAVAVLAFGSSAVFAGTMGPVCAPGSVTVPCEKSAWNFGVQALYLKPTLSNDMGWAGLEVTQDGNVGRFVEGNSTWNWGFKLEGSYHFNTGNDLNLNWYHLVGKTERSHFGGQLASFDVEGSHDIQTTSLKPSWDAVNLEFGQHVDFGEMKNIRFHGGVQWARIKTQYELTDSGTTAVNGVVPSFVVTSNASYNGFGPRIGADMSYDWGNGFAVYANTAGALLVGTSKLDQQYSDNIGNPNDFLLATSGSKTEVVPELEAKLGANYTWIMAQGDLTVDAGYMWANYFNAQKTDLLGAPFTQDANFALNGPYLGLKWVGSVV